MVGANKVHHGRHLHSPVTLEFLGLFIVPKPTLSQKVEPNSKSNIL
jgi:hypothetical protein